jgi:hypothetical protein
MPSSLGSSKRFKMKMKSAKVGVDHGNAAAKLNQIQAARGQLDPTIVTKYEADDDSADSLTARKINTNNVLMSAIAHE